jgi:hypothetical protein
VAEPQTTRTTQTTRKTHAAEASVLTCHELPEGALAGLLAGYGIELVKVPEGEPVPGSWFGAREAGIRGRCVCVRPDTPVHSALHEACHLVCATVEGRGPIDADAGGGYAEEDAVCYLQILLAARLYGFGRDRALADMDAWGYTFRLGSARDWFERDAEDARTWLAARGLVDVAGEPVVRRVFPL